MSYYKSRNRSEYIQAATNPADFDGVTVDTQWNTVRANSLDSDALCAHYEEITREEFITAYEAVKTALQGFVMRGLECAS